MNQPLNVALKWGVIETNRHIKLQQSITQKKVEPETEDHIVFDQQRAKEYLEL